MIIRMIPYSGWGYPRCCGYTSGMFWLDATQLHVLQGWISILLIKLSYLSISGAGFLRHATLLTVPPKPCILYFNDGSTAFIRNTALVDYRADPYPAPPAGKRRAAAGPVGAGRDLQLFAPGFRASLFYAQGPRRVTALCDVEDRGCPAAPASAGRPVDRGPRPHRHLRTRRAVPVLRGRHPPGRRGSAVCRIPAPEGPARSRRAVRRRTQTSAAAISAEDRHRHLRHGRGPAGYAARPGAPPAFG